MPLTVTIDIDVRPKLNPVVHPHIVQRNICRTNMRPIFGPMIWQPQKTMLITGLVSRSLACAFAVRAVVAFKM